APRGEPGASELLAAPGASPAPRTVPDAGGGERVGGALRRVRAPSGAEPGARGGGLLQQLVDDRPARVLLRPLRDPAAAGPPVVACDRGAVLPPVAMAPARRDLAAPEAI